MGLLNKDIRSMMYSILDISIDADDIVSITFSDNEVVQLPLFCMAWLGRITDKAGTGSYAASNPVIKHPSMPNNVYNSVITVQFDSETAILSTVDSAYSVSRQVFNQLCTQLAALKIPILSTKTSGGCPGGCGGGWRAKRYT
jgi:hypothetical protein